MTKKFHACTDCKLNNIVTDKIIKDKMSEIDNV